MTLTTYHLRLARSLLVRLALLGATMMLATLMACNHSLAANPSASDHTGTHFSHTSPTVATRSKKKSLSVAVSRDSKLLRWSNPSSWRSQRVPLSSSRVVIPRGSTVILDQNTSIANLTIQGTLRFARRNLTLESDWVMVHGRLQVGSARSPFRQRATIRIRDQRPNENVMGVMGDRVLGVMGGQLELFGVRRQSWTKLGATALRGSSTILLSSPNHGWRVGERIAIASTDFNFEQMETRIIRRVQGSKITLNKPLNYDHFGELQKLSGVTVDERAEVSLLSRSIRFEADRRIAGSGIGAYIMIMDSGRASIDNVELERVGQLGALRRYPIHFHMLGSAGKRSFVRSSAIYQSFNRCITVHGTNFLRLTNNSCVDHVGHGYFLEDGAEQGNVLVHNLSMGARAAKEELAVLPTDTTPASFWITNLDNTVRNNVAAGSAGHGFWLALPEHPTGLFAKMYPKQTALIWNRRMKLKEFSGNSAHSNDNDGLHFDNGPRPDGYAETSHHKALTNPRDENSKPLLTTLRTFNAWKNRGGGAWLRGTGHRLTKSIFADNAIGATLASDESYVQDSLFVGESANRGNTEAWERAEGGTGRDGRSAARPWDPAFPVRGFEFYDGLVGVERSTFVNFESWNNASGETHHQSALGYLIDNDFTIHPRNFARKLKFINAQRVYLESPQTGHDGDVSAVFVDSDGSITGKAGQAISTTNPFLYGSDCTLNAVWNAQICANAEHATLLVEASSRSSVKPLRITRSDGELQQLEASTGQDAAEVSTSVLLDSEYALAFNGNTPKSARFVLWRGRDRFVIVSLPRSEQFRVLRYGCDVGKAKEWCFGKALSLNALRSSNRSGFFYDDHQDADKSTGTLYLKLASKEADWDELAVEDTP